MSKDTPDKQKNIDDVLMSIDSLLDTATDIELSETSESPGNPTPQTDSTANAGKSAKTSEKPLKPEPRPVTPIKSEQKKPAQTRKMPQSGNISTIQAGAEDAQTASTNSTAQDKKPIIDAQTTSTKTVVQKDELPADKRKPELEPDQSSSSEENRHSDSSQHNVIQDNSTKSLNFTTVDDDLSDAMRELPVLDDIVTIEDLALIGSGKEPPKKILTEAFKRLSLTDKLIKILENQLSDYNISKLEYKYLHELFDELLEKENKNRQS